MNDRSSQPPRVPAWLIALFAAPHEADGILGDLAEGFSADLTDKGEAEARRAYRRHVWRTLVDLTIADWRTQPWSIAALTMLALALWGPVGRVMTMRGVLKFGVVLSVGAALSQFVLGRLLPAGRGIIRA